MHDGFLHVYVKHSSIASANAVADYVFNVYIYSYFPEIRHKISGIGEDLLLRARTISFSLALNFPALGDVNESQVDNVAHMWVTPQERNCETESERV